mgnify:CR=1 FL=1
MSNNISTMYTKSQNLKAGRKGYVSWKTEKETAISPAAYNDRIRIWLKEEVTKK